MLTASDGPRGLAVLGSPIAHSQSPALHAAAYEALGLPWSYGRDEVTPATLGDYVASRPDAWRGLSLTMPLKQSVLPLVSSLDEIARLTGAANTILFDTDASGHRVPPRIQHGCHRDRARSGRRGHHACEIRARLGRGATAASAVVAAAQLGAELVTVQVREPARAEQLIGLGHAVGLRVEIRSFEDPVAERPDLVISTLPGSAGADGGARRIVRGEATARAAADGILLLDVAYDPWPTEVVKVWDARGGALGRTAPHNVLSGLAMLVHQALLQVRIFVTGDPERELPDESVVLTAMLTAVGLDASGRPV